MRTARVPRLLAAVLLISSPIWGQKIPAPPVSDASAVANLLHEPKSTVKKAWRPMSGTAPASKLVRSGRKIVKLLCNLANTTMERASWDRQVPLDLSRHRGVRLSIFCPDLSPIARLTLYFRSGKGWYSAHLAGVQEGRWSIVDVDKGQTVIEGQPAGWAHVDNIRLSAWRGGNTSTALYVAGMSRIGGEATVAVVRCESLGVGGSSELASALKYGQVVSGFLDDLGLVHDVLGDRDLDPRTLAGREVILLPHNPVMPDPGASSVSAFLARGGGLVGFYRLPRQLEAASGFEPGPVVRDRGSDSFSSLHPLPGKLSGAPTEVQQDSWNVVSAKAIPGRSEVAAWWHDREGKPTSRAAILVSKRCIQMTHVLTEVDPDGKRRLLLAMVGRFSADAWQQAVRRSIERIGQVGPHTDFTESQRAISAAGKLPAALLATAVSTRRDAERFLRRQRFPDALEAAGKARAAMLKAWCATLQPVKGEHRAFWCHSAFGVDGMEWDQAIEILARNGFTAVLPNMLWGGAAYYRSSVLPVAPEVAERGDQIEKCLAACKRHGVECHVWKVNWNMSSKAPAEFRSRMLREGRVQVTAQGKPKGEWLCPSHAANQQLEVDSMVEVAEKYAVDGVHFDYIRYPGNDTCYCDGCRARFEKRIGRKVKDWPKAVRRGEQKLRQRWQDFRRSNITSVVSRVSKRAHRARPGVKISAAVFPNLMVDRDGVAQDWGMWCRRGYLDFVCPMDYTPDTGQFQRLVKQQLGWARKVPCYPGIGLSTWKGGAGVSELIDKIAVTRRLRTGGFTVFNLGSREANEVLPLLGLGLTRRE